MFCSHLIKSTLNSCTLYASQKYIGLTDLGEGQDQERSSSTGFDDNRQELWVDGTERAVPGYFGHTNVIVALLSLYRLAEDMAKFTLPHDAATHG